MAIKLKKLWTQIRSRALVWDTITTTGWSTVGKGMGFLVPFFIVAWFGVTAETDVFFFAYGLILFFSMIFAPVVESIIVPYIAEASSNNEDVGKFVGRILGISGIGLLALASIVLLVIKPVLSVITRFDQQSLDLAYWILVETAPLIILLVWTSILAGTLNAYKKFVFPAVSPLFRAVFNIGFIFIFKDALGVHAIALGYVVGEIVRLAVLVGVIKRLKLFKLGLSFSLDPKVKEFLKTASYQTIGMVAVGLNPIVDKIMASWLGSGSVSVLYYGERLYMIPITFLCVGLFPAVLSYWSQDYYQNKGEPLLLKKVNKTAKVIFWISAVVFMIFAFLSRPLVYLAFGRGKFNFEYIHIVQWIFICYLFGLIPYVVGSMFTRVHLVLKNTHFLMKLAILNCFLNIVLNYILMQFIGVLGIALSTSITLSIIAFFLFVSLKKAKI
ncbi:MAG: lipid II flippase MurJ [Candidatus Omnitrophota bacterium]|jgi:putative peptidoglycan lipid II flippase